jgi:hypothetical protein
MGGAFSPPLSPTQSVDLKSLVLYDPALQPYTVDHFRAVANVSSLLRVPVHNIHPSGAVDFAVMSGADSGYSMLKSNIMGFTPGLQDVAFHDYRSSNPSFVAQRRVQGNVFDAVTRNNNNLSYYIYPPTTIDNLSSGNLVAGSLSCTGNAFFNGNATFSGSNTFNGSAAFYKSVAGLYRVTFTNSNQTSTVSRSDIAITSGPSTQAIYLGGISEQDNYLDSRPGPSKFMNLQHSGTTIARYSATGMEFISGGLMIGAFSARCTLVRIATKAIVTGIINDTMALAGADIGDRVLITPIDGSSIGFFGRVSALNSVTFNSVGFDGKTLRAEMARFV